MVLPPAGMLSLSQFAPHESSSTEEMKSFPNSAPLSLRISSVVPVAWVGRSVGLGLGVEAAGGSAVAWVGVLVGRGVTTSGVAVAGTGVAGVSGVDFSLPQARVPASRTTTINHGQRRLFMCFLLRM